MRSGAYGPHNSPMPRAKCLDAWANTVLLHGPTRKFAIDISVCKHMVSGHCSGLHVRAMQPASRAQAMGSTAQAAKGDPFSSRAVLPTGGPAGARAVLLQAPDMGAVLPCGAGLANRARQTKQQSEHPRSRDEEQSLCQAFCDAALQGRSNSALARQHAISRLALGDCALQARRHECVAGSNGRVGCFESPPHASSEVAADSRLHRANVHLISRKTQDQCLVRFRLVWCSLPSCTSMRQMLAKLCKQLNTDTGSTVAFLWAEACQKASRLLSGLGSTTHRQYWLSRQNSFCRVCWLRRNNQRYVDARRSTMARIVFREARQNQA